jgi:hypothetical protein
MNLRLGDHLAAERAEWGVIGRPYSTARRQDRARPGREREAAGRDGYPDVGMHERVAVNLSASR